jgi:hypothetical protein
MGKDRLPKKTLFGALVEEGRRGQGRPPQRLAQTYRKDFKEMALAYTKKFDVAIDEAYFLDGPDPTRRVTRSAAGKMFVSWWTLAMDKETWRVCLLEAWTRKPLALTGYPVGSAH